MRLPYELAEKCSRYPIEARPDAKSFSLFQAAVWIVLALALFFLFKQFEKPEAQESVTYSQFMDEACAGNIKSVVIQGNHLTVTPAVGNPYQLTAPRTPWMVDDLMKYGVAVSAKPEEKPSPLLQMFYV